MTRLKISYSLTRRLSQSRQAAAYMDILSEDHDLVSTQDTAHVVIVHHPPRNYETVYALHPALKDRYVISCCVPHADNIPEGWKRNLPRVQEVWTPSVFCQKVLAQYHPKVTLVPYVIERDMAISPEAISCVKRMLSYDPELVYFLAMGPLDEPRKNIHELVETFKLVSGSMPNARLIVKSTAYDTPTWSHDAQILFFPMQLPFDYISALYELSNVYVSPHHAEAWGLGISDAMLFGKPVIATNHSGNLEYMTPQNSFLLSCSEGVVADQARPGIAVEPGMIWAEPDPDHLAELLLQLYKTHDLPATQRRVLQATEDIKEFSRDRAAKVIRQSIATAMSLSAVSF